MTANVESQPFNRVLVTGAASGIGKACALQLLKAGKKVIALDRVEPDFPVSDFHPLDLSVADSINTAADFALKAGPFDALLNVAGVPPRPEQQLQVLLVNWLGQRLLTRGVLAALRPGAAIVNMASKAGGRWHENLDEIRTVMSLQTSQELETFVASSALDATRAYNLSKEAIIVWTMASAVHLKEKKLRMNCVSPAAVETAILDDFITAFGPMVKKNLSRVGRPGQPEEIAEVAVFLASPQSRWLHGIDVPVDGGMGAMIQAEMMQLDVQELWI